MEFGSKMDSPEMRYGELIKGISCTALLNTALPVSLWHSGGGGGETFQK